VDARDSSGYTPDSRDLIRVKNQIRTEFGLLETDTKELSALIQKEEAKKKVRHPSPASLPLPPPARVCVHTVYVLVDWC
jgi:hypothetical protein